MIATRDHALLGERPDGPHRLQRLDAGHALALTFCGRWKEGEEAAHRAPFSALYCGVASYTQFVGRNCDEAMQLAHTAIRLHPDIIGGCRGLLRPGVRRFEAHELTSDWLRIGRLQRFALCLTAPCHAVILGV